MRWGWGPALQILGALCELTALVTVASGISLTRQEFSGRPWWWARTKAWVLRVMARFRRRTSAELHGNSAGVSGAGALLTRGVKTINWTPAQDLESKVEILREALNNQALEINGLETRVDEETAARKSAVTNVETYADQLHLRALDRIATAAMGGLKLQTLGLALLVAGLIFGLWGNLIS